MLQQDGKKRIFGLTKPIFNKKTTLHFTALEQHIHIDAHGTHARFEK
jgi:hypothetical protein